MKNITVFATVNCPRNKERYFYRYNRLLNHASVGDYLLFGTTEVGIAKVIHMLDSADTMIICEPLTAVNPREEELIVSDFEENQWTESKAPRKVIPLE